MKYIENQAIEENNYTLFPAAEFINGAGGSGPGEKELRYKAYIEKQKLHSRD